MLETSSRTFRCASRTDANGETLEYRIAGINHDDLADGPGKAGLTFLTTSRGMYSRVNAMDTSNGGWEKSELRGRLNTGDLWSLLPGELQSKVKSVVKMTDNKGDDTDTPSATTDKVFLISSTEVWGDIDGDGTQYEYYKSKGVTVSKFDSNFSGASSVFGRWTRSVISYNPKYYRYVSPYGDSRTDNAMDTCNVSIAFCF